MSVENDIDVMDEGQSSFQEQEADDTMSEDQNLAAISDQEDGGEAIVVKMEEKVIVRGRSKRLQLDAYPSLVSVVCGVCKKDFPLEKNVAAEYLAGALYTCDICRSRSEKKLRLHKLLHNGAFPRGREPAAEKKKIPCAECGKTFNSRKDMKRHLRTHTGEKPHVCRECGKCFAQVCSLRRHLITHTGLKPHKCEVCGLMFKGHLARHMRSHTGEKPFMCEICLKGFFRSEHLRKHLSTHVKDGALKWTNSQIDEVFKRCTTLKLYTCDDCGKKYTTSGHLARHKRIHTGAKPYRCEVCHRSFQRKEHLKRHSATHKPGEEHVPVKGEEREEEEEEEDDPAYDDLVDFSNLSEKEDDDEEPEEAAIETGPIVNGDLHVKDEVCLDEVPCDVQDEQPVKQEYKDNEEPTTEDQPQLHSGDVKSEEHVCDQNSVTCGMCGETCCCTESLTTHLDTHTVIDCRECGGDIIVSKTGPKQTTCQMCAAQKKHGKPQARSSSFEGQADLSVKGRRERARIPAWKREAEAVVAKVGAPRQEVHSCGTCGQSFSLRKELRRHSKNCTDVQVVVRRGRPRGRPPKGRGRPPLGGATTHKCNVCDKKFVQSLHLRQHLVLHLKEGHITRSHPQLKDMGMLAPSNAKPLHRGPPKPQHHKCHLCGKLCKGGHLARHLRSHARFKCLHCPLYFTRTKLLMRHIVKVHGVEESDALLTALKPDPAAVTNGHAGSKGGVSGAAMEDVRTEDVGDWTNQAPGMSPDENQRPNGHIIAQDQPDLPDTSSTSQAQIKCTNTECTQDTINCGICGYACCCTKYIALHMNTHYLRAVTCETCGIEVQVIGEGFVDSNGEKSNNCDACRARSEKKMRLHQILRNRVLQSASTEGGRRKRKKHACKHCGQCFRLRSDLAEHVQSHTLGSQFKCEVCGMVFALSRNLRRHMRTHKPTSCNVCGKMITGHMARHMRIHSSVRAYTCQYCDKGFNRSEHLKRHVQTHFVSRDKPHKCNLCDKYFQRKEHLKRHLKTHTSEDPFSDNSHLNLLQASEESIHAPSSSTDGANFGTGVAAFSTSGAIQGTDGATFSTSRAIPYTDDAACSTNGAIPCTDGAAFSTSGTAYSSGGDIPGTDGDTFRTDGGIVSASGATFSTSGAVPSTDGATLSQEGAPAEDMHHPQTAPQEQEYWGETSEPIERYSEQDADPDADESFDATESLYTKGEVYTPQPTPDPLEPIEHDCMHSTVICEICHQTCCCAVYLMSHLDTHAMINVRCAMCRGDFRMNRTDVSAQTAGGEYVCESCAIRAEKRSRLDHVLDSRILRGGEMASHDAGIDSPFFQKVEHSIDIPTHDAYPEITENSRSVSNDDSSCSTTINIPVPAQFVEQAENMQGIPDQSMYIEHADNSQGNADPGAYHEEGVNANEKMSRTVETQTREVGELYHCGICGKNFSAQSDFKRHLASHTGEKSHKCEVCGQTFSGHLARHMRTHSAVKRFTCHVCKKGFNRGEHLKRHLRTHEHQLEPTDTTEKTEQTEDLHD